MTLTFQNLSSTYLFISSNLYFYSLVPVRFFTVLSQRYLYLFKSAAVVDKEPLDQLSTKLSRI